MVVAWFRVHGVLTEPEVGRLLEEIARGSGSLALIVAAHTAMVGLPLYRLGTAALRGAWLQRLLSGEVLGGLVLAEPNPGGAAPRQAGGRSSASSVMMRVSPCASSATAAV